MPFQHVTRKACFLLLLGTCVLYAILALRSPERWAYRSPQSTVKEKESVSVCDRYPDKGDIAVSVKTGATEFHQKLPAMLNTSLACIRNVMIFSDLEQTLGDIQIHDVLSNFSRDATKGNPDFDIYWRQKELVSEHRDNEIESLAEMLAPERDWQTRGKSASWGLDKYKFLHMLEMAYKLQPNRDWYLFLEADTYLSWANLNRYLPSLGMIDPTVKLYLGNSMHKSDRPPTDFAHGGSGFILSGAAMKEFAVDRKGIASRLDRHTHKWWAGDMMLADVLHSELSLQVTNAAPMFHHIDGIFTPPPLVPAIAIHHVAPSEFEKIYRREQEVDFSELLLNDVYTIVHAANHSSEHLADNIKNRN